MQTDPRCLLRRGGSTPVHLRRMPREKGGYLVRHNPVAYHLARLKVELQRRNWFGIRKGAPVCARCDRVGYMRVNTDHGVEWRCDWHVTDSLPPAVKHLTFHSRGTFI